MRYCNQNLNTVKVIEIIGLNIENVEMGVWIVVQKILFQNFLNKNP